MIKLKNTKIVCTIGPSSESVAMLGRLMRAGMNVARLNFSHGTRANHRMLVRNIRKTSKLAGIPAAIIADLQGPKVRVGVLPKEGVKLVIGKTVVFKTGTEKMQAEKIPIPYAGLARDLKKGDKILLDDGLLEVEVVKINGREIETRVISGGVLTSHKGFNIPTASIKIPNLTAKDVEDLNFALAQKVDFVAISFVRQAQDIIRLRKILSKKKENKNIQIIAKIEKHEAVKNFKEILEVADCIMVARGDLAVETSAEDVPILQKRIIGECLRSAKPVIVATQMLDSMIRNPRPTRAEVSDIANAVVDHTDAVMLSGETATGKFPFEAVDIMSKVISETEASPYDDLSVESIHDHFKNQNESLGELARLISEKPEIKLIAVTTITGKTARAVARFRPKVPIVAFTNDERVGHQLLLSWGVKPLVVSKVKTFDGLFNSIKAKILKNRLAKKGDKIVVVTGEPIGKPGKTNQVRIVQL